MCRGCRNVSNEFTLKGYYNNVRVSYENALQNLN